MNIQIPQWLVRAWGWFVEWGNVPLGRIHRLEIRRLDILIVLLGVCCACYYGWLNGWQGAILGLAVYVLLAAIGLML